jgi:hypothetical protein
MDFLWDVDMQVKALCCFRTIGNYFPLNLACHLGRLESFMVFVIFVVQQQTSVHLAI